MVKEVTPQKHTYVCSEDRTVVRHACALPCTSANRGESSSDLCTMKGAIGAGLFMLANEGAVAEASKAICTCNYRHLIVQYSSAVVQFSVCELLWFKGNSLICGQFVPL